MFCVVLYNVILVHDWVVICFFFFKQKTAYEMRISDWSSDVCSSDLAIADIRALRGRRCVAIAPEPERPAATATAAPAEQTLENIAEIGAVTADRKSVV